MNGQGLILIDNFDEKIFQSEKLKRNINIIAFFGITSIFINYLCRFLVYIFGLNRNSATYILVLIFNTFLSVLVIALLFAIPCRGIKTCLRKYERKLGVFDSALLVIYGFGICISINYIVGLLANVFSLPVISNSDISDNTDIFSVILQTLALAVIPALCEEIAFRGFVMGSISDFGKGFAIIISSLFFGMLHGNLMSVIFAFLTGILFGCIRKTSGSLIPSMIVHFLNNSMSIWENILINTMSPENFGKIFIAFNIILLMLTITFAYMIRERNIGLFKFLTDGCLLSKSEKVRITLTRPLFWVFVVWAVCIVSMQR